MKCLLVSDIHYALQQFDWITSVADKFDVVIIAGDHIDISGHVDGPTQITIILKYLRRLNDKALLIVSSGNHDLDSRNPAGEKFARWMSKVRDLGVPTDGDSVEVGDTLFTICPWWDGPKTRDKVGEQFARDAMREKHHWVWVYHAPPDESPISWTGARHYGDADLVRWIQDYRPDIVLTGHIHQSPFCTGGSWVDQIGTTWVFNAGRQPGSLPTHIIFDTDRNIAMWFSLAGAEITRLDEPLCRPIAELTALPDWLKS